jgi:hypothetical protein
MLHTFSAPDASTPDALPFKRRFLFTFPLVDLDVCRFVTILLSIKTLCDEEKYSNHHPIAPVTLSGSLKRHCPRSDSFDPIDEANPRRYVELHSDLLAR